MPEETGLDFASKIPGRMHACGHDAHTALLVQAVHLLHRHRDELAGLVTAAALVRPNGITDLTASSVKKKMKSKGFARTVNRDDITRGAADFNVDLTEHIQFIIDALKPHAAELGLLQGLATADE